MKRGRRHPRYFRQAHQVSARAATIAAINYGNGAERAYHFDILGYIGWILSATAYQRSPPDPGA